MKVEKQLDEKLKTEFRKSTEEICPSESVKRRIDTEIISTRTDKGRSLEMMNRSFIKAAAIAVACLALSGTTVFAVSQATGWVSHGRPYEYTKYDDLEKVAKKSGLSIELPEEFYNGYAFEYASVQEFGQIDDDGNRLNNYKGADVIYILENEPNIFINIESLVPNMDMGEDALETRKIADGITAYYDVHEMLIVPPDYKVSEEDLEREKSDPKFWISYGSDEVTRQKAMNVDFFMEGQKYSIMGFDLSLTSDEMFDMAYEIAEY